MEKEILKTNPVQRLALHVADMGGFEFLEKRNEKQISELYANARRYLKIRKKNLDALCCMMYADNYDGRCVSRYENFGAILSARILDLLN